MCYSMQAACERVNQSLSKIGETQSRSHADAFSKAVRSDFSWVISRSNLQSDSLESLFVYRLLCTLVIRFLGCVCKMHGHGFIQV